MRAPPCSGMCAPVPCVQRRPRRLMSKFAATLVRLRIRAPPRSRAPKRHWSNATTRTPGSRVMRSHAASRHAAEDPGCSMEKKRARRGRSASRSQGCHGTVAGVSRAFQYGSQQFSFLAGTGHNSSVSWPARVTTVQFSGPHGSQQFSFLAGTGHNSSVFWPARSQQVLCLFSTERYGYITECYGMLNAGSDTSSWGRLAFSVAFRNIP